MSGGFSFGGRGSPFRLVGGFGAEYRGISN